MEGLHICSALSNSFDVMTWIRPRFVSLLADGPTSVCRGETAVLMARGEELEAFGSD